MMEMNASPAPAQEQAGGQNIEMQLVQLLRQAMMLAQKNGINFADVVNKVMGGSSAAPPMP